MTAALSSSAVSPVTSGASPRARIAVFAATVWEAGAVRAALPQSRGCVVDGHRFMVCTLGGREYWLVRTGIGPDKAGLLASWFLRQARFDLVISTGFACALVPAEIGALLVGCESIAVRQDARSSEVFEVSGPEREAFLTFAGREMPQRHFGRFISVGHIVGRASEKRAYAQATGAIGLDMESAALAREAEKAQVPFVIARTVSDLLDEDLPLDFNAFLRPTGWLKGLASVLGAPSSLLGLGRLRRQSLMAAQNLTAFFRQYAAAPAAESRATMNGTS